MNDSPLEHRAAPHAPLHRETEPIGLGDRAMVSIEAQVISVEAEDARVVRSAEARGASDHRVEHGLQVRGRAADRSQDLARRRLLLQRVGQSLLQSLDPRQ